MGYQSGPESNRFNRRDLECLEKGPVLSLEGAHGGIINAMDGMGGQQGASECWSAALGVRSMAFDKH